jgi:hypothetical protein
MSEAGVDPIGEPGNNRITAHVGDRSNRTIKPYPKRQPLPATGLVGTEDFVFSKIWGTEWPMFDTVHSLGIVCWNKGKMTKQKPFICARWSKLRRRWDRSIVSTIEDGLHSWITGMMPIV